MSDLSLKEEDDELQLGTYKLEAEQEVQQIASKEKVDVDSDLSTDSSATSHKQLKGPHTLLKHSGSGISKGSLPAISNSLILLENDQAEQFHRLLEEAEQTISSRDVIITMLQEQLKKIENLYKQSLDDTEELRLKHCVTLQDLNNLRTICEKYKEDVEILSKTQENEDTKKELETLQNEVDFWKSQHTDLLNHIKVVEKEITETERRISQGVQVEFLEYQNLQTDLNTLKEHCISIKNCLEGQDTKIDFVVQKLQETPTQPEPDHNQNKCEESTRELHESRQKIHSSNLKDDVENLKIQIEELTNKHKQLQNEILEIQKLREEINKIAVRLGTEEIPAQHFMGSSVDVKDSIVEKLKKENEYLRSELEAVKNSVQFFDSTDDSNSINGSVTEEIPNAPEHSQQTDGKRTSKVSFAVSPNHLELELTELHNENILLKQKIKELQGNSICDNERERLTVEVINLRRQLKKKDDDMDQLKHEADTIENRKNAIIKEFQNANELLKIDYQDLLELNNKLKQTGICEKMASNRSLHETSTQDASTNTEDVYDTIKVKSHSVTQESDTIPNKDTTDIIKEAVSESIYTEMEKFKSSLCNHTECKMVIEENRRIKDELNNKSKQLETMKNNLEIKTTNAMEKETIIKRKNSEIEHLKKIIKDNNDIINELNNKKKEINEFTSQVRDLQTTIDLLKIKLEKALEENENNHQDIQDHKGCKCKLKKLESRISELSDLNKKLRKENEGLNAQINRIQNDLQQYREEADFKKMENEKLRKQEHQLQSKISSVRRTSENIANDYHKEVEKNKIALSEITKKYNDMENEFQIKIKKLNEENEKLKKSLQEKDEETKTLTDKINTITKELDDTQSLHEKHLKRCDRSICEITDLFKNKEDELLAALHELQGHQQDLETLQEENTRLKILLQANMEANENIEYSLTLKQNIELKLLEDNYNNEKIKNTELNNFLNKIRNEMDNFKIQVKELLQNLKNSLQQLKKGILNNEFNVCKSKMVINEMLDYIEKFNKNVLQQHRSNIDNSGSSETENYSYFYETGNCCRMVNTDNESPNEYKHPESNSDLCCTSANELQIKRKYLIKQLEGIDEKLNNPLGIIPTPKCISSSESVQTSQTKSSDKDSYRTCPQICEANDEEKPNKTNNNYANIGNSCSPIICSSWLCNSETKSNRTPISEKDIQEETDSNIRKSQDDTLSSCSPGSCPSLAAANSEVVKLMVTNSTCPQITEVNTEEETDSKENRKCDTKYTNVCSFATCSSQSINFGLVEHTPTHPTYPKLNDETSSGNSSIVTSPSPALNSGMPPKNNEADTEEKTSESSKESDETNSRCSIGTCPSPAINSGMPPQNNEADTEEESSKSSKESQESDETNSGCSIGTCPSLAINSGMPPENNEADTEEKTSKSSKESQESDETNSCNSCSIAPCPSPAMNSGMPSQNNEAYTEEKSSESSKESQESNEMPSGNTSCSLGTCPSRSINSEMPPQNHEAGEEIPNTESIDSQESDDINAGSSCSSSTCPSWTTNSEILKLMATELYATETDPNIQGQNYTNGLDTEFLKNHSIQNIQISPDRLEIKVLPEDLTICIIANSSNLNETEQPKLENIEEMPEPEVLLTNKADSETFSASTSEEENDEDSAHDVDLKEEKDEVNEQTVNYSECRGCSSQQPNTIRSIINDACNQTTNNLKVVKQYPNNNASRSSKTVPQQNRKCTPTGIPVLVQNSRRMSKERCPVIASKNTTSKRKDCNITQKPLNTHGQTCNHLTIGNQTFAGAKGPTQPACACLKRNSGVPAASQIHKTCVCVSSNKKDTSHLAENATNGASCATKSINQCKCKCTSETKE